MKFLALAIKIVCIRDFSVNRWELIWRTSEVARVDGHFGRLESVRRGWRKLCKSGRKALINTLVSDRYADLAPICLCKMAAPGSRLSATQLPGSSPAVADHRPTPSSFVLHPRRFRLSPSISRPPLSPLRNPCFLCLPHVPTLPTSGCSFSHPALDEASPTSCATRDDEGADYGEEEEEEEEKAEKARLRGCVKLDGSLSPARGPWRTQNFIGRGVSTLWARGWLLHYTFNDAV